MYTGLKHTEEAKKYFGVNWALTTKCNFRCSYCHPDLHNGKIKTADYSVVSGFVNRIFDHCDERGLVPYFEYGGGEVTYLKWFGDLLSLINQRGGLVSIISNGSSSLDWWRTHVSALHSACLSFHVEEVGDHERFIEVVRIVEQSPTTILHVNVMMLPERFEECLSFAKRLREEVACSISLQPLYHGFGSPSLKGRFHYDDEQDEIMKSFRGRESEKRLPEPRGYMVAVNQAGEEEKKAVFDLLVEQKTNFTGWQCNAGIENIIVMFSGEIHRAWCMQGGMIGHISDDNLFLPERPMVCQTTICQCGADICSTKIKVDTVQIPIMMV
ncbi:radical SAM protein [Chitiniphilus shinanonensis]|uniref:radical SAM protein n=1 Tax=Chitiniphilus shinanonensis TaxID=553088 RepID=UPI000685C382|nr:radical SAM protein [Chitiniphilus shinanonensis]